MRGKASSIGQERVAQNGYHYIKVERDGKAQWILKHWLVAEKKLGRRIREDERVVFLNGKKHDFRPENIEVREKGKGSVRRRLAQVRSRIEELQAEEAELLRELQGMPLVRRNSPVEENDD